MSRRMLLASGWTLIVLILCWTPRQHLPTPEDQFATWRLPHLDKLVHLGMFALFGALWSMACPRGDRAWRIVLCGAALAALTEIGQLSPYVSRDADVYDALADVIGTIAGVAVASWARRPQDVGLSGDGEVGPSG